MKAKNGVKEPLEGITINIPDVPVEVDEYLREEASQRDMSKAAVIRVILKDYVTRATSSETCLPAPSVRERSTSR